MQNHTIGFTNETFTGLTTVLSDSFTLYLDTFTFFFIGIILLVVGFYIGNYAFNIASGVWFLSSASYSLFGFGSLQGVTVLFFVLVGILAIYDGIHRIVENKSKQTQRTINDDE